MDCLPSSTENKSIRANLRGTLHIGRTVPRIVTRKPVRMRLNGQREEDLSISAEIDPAYQLVDFCVVEIMTEDDECVLDVFGCSEANNQVLQVFSTGVDLDDDDYCRVVDRAEYHFVVDELECITNKNEIMSHRSSAGDKIT